MMTCLTAGAAAGAVGLSLLLLATTVLGARHDAFIGYTEKAGSAPPTVILLWTDYGQIPIKLAPELAPATCRLVADLARKGVCPQCRFYRHEPVPDKWGVNNFYGPPYALLQGSLADLADTPPFENKGRIVQQGDACIIPDSKEFFIATADHGEWGKSHTIFGQVLDMSTEPKIPFEPYHSLTDGGNITTRWLDATYPFKISLLSSGPTGDQATAA